MCFLSCFLRGVFMLRRHEELRIGDMGVFFSPTAR